CTVSAANYSFTFEDGKLTVCQAELIAQAEDQSRVFGTTNPVFTIKYSGFVNGETAVVVDVPPVASTLAVTNSPTGTYAITLLGGSDDNYTLTLVDGILTVTAAPPPTVNQPPTLAAIPDQTVNELTTLIVAASASDPEAGPLTYQLTQAPAGASIDAGGVVRWTPTEIQGPGTNTFTVQVADNGAPPL